KQIAEKMFLKENYFLIFEKKDTAKEASTMLVEPEQLQTMLTRADLRIIDTRPQADYVKGHIPGAVRVDVKRWQQLGSKEAGFHDAKSWAFEVGRLGIRNHSLVVVYGDKLPDTARIWWTLKYLGLGHVVILDGGWKFWIKKSRPTETLEPTIDAVKFEPTFQA